MATITKHLQPAALNSALLNQSGFLKLEIDFSVTANNIVSGDIVPIFAIPAGGCIKGYGAKIVTPETATVADAALGVYTESGGTYTLDADTDVPVDVDAAAGTLCAYGPSVALEAAYMRNTTGYIGITAGGTMDECKILFWVEFSVAPVA